jgi:nitroreductase
MTTLTDPPDCKNPEWVSSDFSTLQRLVTARHSCRAFKRDEVPRSTIQFILEAAQRAASDCNIQPWYVAVLSGGRLNKLREAMYTRAASGAPPVADIPPITKYSGVYQERRRECGWSLYGALGIAKGDRAASGQQALENFRFFNAPHLALITTHASLGARALLDCGGYLNLFLLAAQALGVATVPQASISYRADVIREQLDLTDEQHVVCGIAFGWSDVDALANSYRTTRAPLNHVTEFLS